jgi:hypothetical protein
MGLFLPHGRCCGPDGKALTGTRGDAITNRIAIYLALAIIAFLLFDFLRYDWQMTVFLARKFLNLLDYIKFWR